MAVRRTAPGDSVTFRALGLLNAFDETHRVLSLSQVARRTGTPLATTHRRLRDLVDGRLLQQRTDGLYEIGARTWHLGQLARPTSMREAALPHLQDLVLRTGQTVHVGVRDGLTALVIDRLAGSRTFTTRHLPGSRLPLHSTGIGKVLLAFAPDDVQRQALARLTSVTEFTVTDPARLRRDLDQVRRRRLAESLQQNRLGVGSLAVPVFGQGETVMAAIGLLASGDVRLASLEDPLRACSHAVSRAVEALEQRWYEQ
ncbi:IclR family transcriptional regulator [Nocardioides sp. CFH 31398]|uniref:IclR family transcriptional regulator n=1 Tax=Nocardioides sp. CFH 31398 TaxID=2919579 RepID=UPI001F0558EB|nr:IclR family transcriptional regulator [Nocardioides sp. CFH 31398]MCH1865505.1 IclR family transcriptional regulator [Nocardioides sp. CFH 31398]